MRLGWLWWFLEPLLFTFVYLFIFSFVFQKTMLYAIPYISIGKTMWSFFNGICRNSVTTIQHYRGLLSRSEIPKYVLLINSMLINGFKMCISFLIALALMIYYHVPATPMWLLFLPILAVFLVLCFGVGLWLLHFGVYFPDLKNIVPVALQILFYLSGIFYSLEGRLGNIEGQMVLRYNPVGCLLFEARNVLLYQRLVFPVELGVWLAVGLFLCMTGLKLIETHEKNYIKVICK